MNPSKFFLCVVAASCIAIPALAQAGRGRPAQAPPNVMTGTVTQVNENGNTFTISANGKDATFSANTLKVLPKVGETIDVVYIRTHGGRMEASSVRPGKLQRDEESPLPPKPKRQDKERDAAWMSFGSATVTQVNADAKTLTVTANGKEVTFSAKRLKALPAVGETMDVTYTQTPNGLEALSLQLAPLRELTPRRTAAPSRVMSGNVTQVNEKDKTFTVMANGKESSFSAKTLTGLPKVGETVDVTYTETPAPTPMPSNVSKMLYDTALSVIRKIGG